MVSNNQGRIVEKRQDKQGGTPVCPLMSVNQPNIVLCLQDGCAMYVKNYKLCSFYLLGHNAGMDIKARQTKK